MKKTFCAVLVLGFMAIAGTASALPPVTLDPLTCEAWGGFEGIAAGLWTGTNAIWDAVGFLNWNGTEMEPNEDMPGFPLTWETADLEGLVGDGLLDRLQLALLSASLCAGDPGVTAQYGANAVAFAGLMAKFYALIAAVTTPVNLPVALTTDSGALTTLANGLPPGPPYDTYKAQMLALAAAMSHVPTGEEDPGASQVLADFAARFGQYVPIFELLGPWFIGMAGTSAAMDATIEEMMFNEDYGIVKDVPPAGEALGTLAGYLHGIAALLPGLGQPALAAALEADADALDAMVVIIATIAWPEIEIYGAAKTATEPFSGTGDYDGNGDTNAEVAAKVGSDPETFVAAASGANDWYSGNPDLPVAGILGLALLAGACVMGGAASIRRK